MEEKQFCRFCGESIAADAVICPKCGRALRNEPQKVKKQVGDSKSVGFAFLCFLVPPLGLILYLMWKKDRPLIAGSCRKGALIGLICWIIVVVVLVAVKPNVPRELLGVWKSSSGNSFKEWSFYPNGISRMKFGYSNGDIDEYKYNFRVEGNTLYYSLRKYRYYPEDVKKAIIKNWDNWDNMKRWLEFLKWKDHKNSKEYKSIFEVRGNTLYFYSDSEGDKKISSYSKVGK